jgi:hypothetical protein
MATKRQQNDLIIQDPVKLLETTYEERMKVLEELDVMKKEMQAVIKKIEQTGLKDMGTATKRRYELMFKGYGQLLQVHNAKLSALHNITEMKFLIEEFKREIAEMRQILNESAVTIEGERIEK